VLVDPAQLHQRLGRRRPDARHHGGIVIHLSRLRSMGRRWLL